jgi:hypothetical protein
MPDSAISWGWWFFTAIILSMLVNIISDYVKPKLDLIWQKYSTKQNLKNENERNEINHIVDNMLKNQQDALYVYSRTNVWEIRRAATLILNQVSLMFGMITLLIAPPGLMSNIAYVFFFLFAMIFITWNRNIKRKLAKYDSIRIAYRKRVGLGIY